MLFVKKTRRQMMSYNRTKEHVDKLSAQLDEVISGKIPNGTKPFAVPFQAKVWSTGIPKDVSDGLSFSTTFMDTFESARKKSLLQALHNNLIIDIAVEKMRLSEYLECIKIETFIKDCTIEFEKEKSAIDEMATALNAPSLFNDLSIELRKVALLRYRRMVRDCAMKNKEATDVKNKLKEREKKALEKASKLTPAQVLEKTFSNFLKKNKGNYAVGPTDINYEAMIEGIQTLDPQFSKDDPTLQKYAKQAKQKKREKQRGRSRSRSTSSRPTSRSASSKSSTRPNKPGRRSKNGKSPGSRPGGAYPTRSRSTTPTKKAVRGRSKTPPARRTSRTSSNSSSRTLKSALKKVSFKGRGKGKKGGRKGRGRKRSNSRQ